MNRRNFLQSIGALGIFNILPGAGRVWRVQKPELYQHFPNFHNTFVPTLQDYLVKENKLCNEALETVKAWDNLLQPGTWPSNLGSTRRLVIQDSTTIFV